MIIDGPPGTGFESYSEGPPSMGEEMWMGRTPAQLHVESFYDDPYACEEDCNPVPSCFDGAICRWLHQFGRPYYGWKWYRDFTASVGVTAFETESDLGVVGNFGTNEYLNFAMPLWNAFGLGWQIGARGTQTGFGSQQVSGGGAAPTLIEARNQQFVTTGLYTRAFEGRGLQGGAAFDYLNNTGFVGTADIKQMRGEISYVWGYHELGFWGAFNAGKGLGFFDNNTQNTFENNTVHTYNAFYRVQFGDANESFYTTVPLPSDALDRQYMKDAKQRREFKMENQPQLVQLEKTLLNIEGLGRQLYPQLDIVAAAKPVLDEWKDQQTNLKSVLNKLQKDAPEIKRTIEELPTLAKQFLAVDLRSNDTNEDFLKSVSKTFYQSLLGLAVMLVGGVLLGLEVLAGWWLLGFGFIMLLLSKPKS